MLMSSGSSCTLIALHAPAHTFTRNSPNSTASRLGSPSSSHLRISLQHRTIVQQAVCGFTHRDMCCFQLRKAPDKTAATAGTELHGLLLPANKFDLHACMQSSAFHGSARCAVNVRLPQNADTCPTV